MQPVCQPSNFSDQSALRSAPSPIGDGFVVLENLLLNFQRCDRRAFLDVYGDRVPEYAQTAVAAATKAGLVTLYPKPQNLDAPATRAEAAAMMYQALVYQGQMTALNSPYIVKV